VFLQEYFVLLVLYAQRKACPFEVHSRAFPDFRKMLSVNEKGQADLDREI